MTDSSSFEPFTFSLGKARITALSDGILTAPIGSLYRLAS